MRKILSAWVFVVAAGLAIGALGALGNQIYMGGPGGAAWRTISGDFALTNAGVATINPGVVGNSKLANASTTVNGQNCTLGSSCTVTAAATSLTVGTTTVTGGTNDSVEYNNSGVLGELATLGSGSVFLTSDANVAFLDVTQSFTKGQAVTPTTIGSGTCTGTYTLTPDGVSSNDYVLTCAAGTAITIANPTTVTPGFTLNFRIKQPSSGAAATLAAVGSYYLFPASSLPVLSAANNAIDFISCRVETTMEIECSPGLLNMGNP